MEPRTSLTGLSWNSHALLTRAALRSACSPRLDDLFPVVKLEDFLSIVQGGIQIIIQWYWDLLARKTKGSARKETPPAGIRTERDFLEALRINPNHSIRYVRVISVDEVSSTTPHDPSRSGPPSPAYVETLEGERLSAREILCAFSDEPDWGMDQELFTIAEYGYGASPFGGETGPSSQAPFHMAFFYENPLLVAVVPGLRLSFMEERVRVFFALAQLALNHGVHYWAWRFTAWAMHYLQDLCQPYHARAIPVPLRKILRRVLKARDLKTFVERNGNLLRNSHLVFEAAVHFMLNDAFKRFSTHPFLLSLAEGGESNAGTVRSVMLECAKVAAGLAVRTSEAVVKLMEDPRLDDPDYLLSDDPAYRIDETLTEAAKNRPEDYRRFVELTRISLMETGRVTRFAVRRAEALGTSK